MIDQVGGIDGSTEWVPPGPTPTKPEHLMNFMYLPHHKHESSYILQVGWVLDGEDVPGRGNDKAVQKWMDEIADEKGIDWLNKHHEWAISGWALYGEIRIRRGSPLEIGDYLLAGFQTDPNANYSRVAKVEGVFFPDPTNADGKKLQYLTSTYKH